mmetsp:Transcript_65346/g.160900  ORF Transcript_65346/g.160900 Transcript_65346/m.160900 type:complete len:502 (-) Transcript_65346:144-1649(-)
MESKEPSLCRSAPSLNRSLPSLRRPANHGVLQAVEQLLLLVRVQQVHLRQDLGHGRVRLECESGSIYSDEDRHDDLAVHAVGDAPVPRDEVPKVLDLEGALEARREEAPEGRHERGEDRQIQAIPHEGRKEYFVPQPQRVDPRQRRRPLQPHGYAHGDRGDEVGVPLAPKIGEQLESELLLGADHVLEVPQQVPAPQREDDRRQERPEEALPGLLRGELDERGLAPEAPEDVGIDIVPDDEADGDKEPDHPVVHVVDHARRRHDDHEEGHVRPPELCELVLVRALLELEDEGAEAHGPEHERLERVVRGEEAHDGVLEMHDLDVPLQDLPVHEVDADDEEIPVKNAEVGYPRVFLPVPLEREDLLEHADLEDDDEGHDVEVPAGDDGEEAQEHREGPARSRPEFSALALRLLLGRHRVGRPVRVREPLAARLQVPEVDFGGVWGRAGGAVAFRPLIVGQVPCIVVPVVLRLRLRLGVVHLAVVGLGPRGLRDVLPPSCRGP